MAAAAQQAQKKKKKHAGAFGSTIDSTEMEIPEMFDHAPGILTCVCERERAVREREPEKEPQRDSLRKRGSEPGVCERERAGERA